MHTHEFSHEFEDGPSGPARSYWDIRRNGKHILTVCLHPRKNIDPVMQVTTICHALDQAFQAGRVSKAIEVQKVLGIKQ